MGYFKGILFDNDGTLVDTHDLILSSFRYATQTVLGHALPDDVLMAKVGTPLAEQMKDFSNDPTVQEELLRVYREHNHRVHDQAISLFPDVLDGLREAHGRGVRMGVVTAKLHALAWHGLEITGAAPYLDVLVGADDCPAFKPDPAPVRTGAAQLDLQPEQCLYVGDSPFDMQAGNAAGCTTVAVLWGMFSEERLRAEEPAYVISSFDELLALL